MIHHLRGCLTHKDASGVVVEAGGVGYRAAISAAALAALPAVGEDVLLLTHLIVREDDVQLVGFASEEERRLFLLLLSVASVGPKVALAVLGLGTDAVHRAVAFGDDAILRSVPGVGRKTAERVVLELRDKLGAPDAPAAAGGQQREGGARQDAVEALQALGYGPAEAARAVAAALEALSPEAGGSAAGKQAGPPAVEAIVRQALTGLGASA